MVISEPGMQAFPEEALNKARAGDGPLGEDGAYTPLVTAADSCAADILYLAQRHVTPKQQNWMNS